MSKGIERAMAAGAAEGFFCLGFSPPLSKSEYTAATQGMPTATEVAIYPGDKNDLQIIKYERYSFGWRGNERVAKFDDARRAVAARLPNFVMNEELIEVTTANGLEIFDVPVDEANHMKPKGVTKLHPVAHAKLPE